MSEQWRGIPGFEGRYQVSEHGDPGISRHRVKRERSVRGKPQGQQPRQQQAAPAQPGQPYGGGGDLGADDIPFAAVDWRCV